MSAKETTTPAADERRDRYWHPTHGPGHLISTPGKLGGRWESDNGTTLELDAVESKIGRPGKRLTGKPGGKCEEWNWYTLTLRTGETFIYRDSPPLIGGLL